MKNYLELKEYKIDFVDNLPYKLGSTFDENNIDLELKYEVDEVTRYRSYRYSEIVLFGTLFEAECYLWFAGKFLLTIEYKFENKHFEWFKECINCEMPDGFKLQYDPLEMGNSTTVFLGLLMVSLMKLDEKYFLLRVSYHDRF